MADEITNALLVTNGGRISAVMSGMLLQKLYDPTDLRATMLYVPFQGLGSATSRVTLDAVPLAAAAASSETSGGQSNSAYTTTKADFTVARYVLQYQLTDLFGVSGPGATGIDFPHVVGKLSQSIGITLTDLLAAAFPGVANAVGSTGVDLSVDNMFSAMFQLNTNSVPGPYHAVLHPVQIDDFITSLRGETGAMEYLAATADQLRLKGPGYRGNWNGIDIWQSDSCTLVNGTADRSGCMFGRGAFGYTLAPTSGILAAVPPQNVLADAGLAMVELSRDATNGMSTAILNFYPAVVEVEDLRACEIITDA